MNDIQNFSMALGLVIRAHRERLGLTRAQLAQKVGGSESHIKALEARKRNPTITVFVLLAGAFELEPHMFLSEVMQKLAFLDARER